MHSCTSPHSGGEQKSCTYQMMLNNSSSGVYSDGPGGGNVSGGIAGIADPDEIVHLSGVHAGASSGGGGGNSIIRFPDDLELDKPLGLDLEEEEESIYSDEGIAGIDIPENILLEELVFADNITSCNKVENVVMLSEYEQNLSKEKEWEPPPPPPAGEEALGNRKLFRKWSLFRNSTHQSLRDSQYATSTVTATSPSPETSSSPAREIPTFQNTTRKLPSSHKARNQITIIEE